MPASAMPRVVAYLVNVYPSPSHTFIRREIAALEALGWRVHRFSHRRCAAELVEPADRAEVARTEVLREARASTVFGALLGAFARSPTAAIAALLATWRMAWRSDRRFVAHCGYFVLACVLVRRLHQLGCRHVHAHFGTNPAAVALLANRLAGTSFSVTCHGPHEFVLPDRLDLADKLAGAAFFVVVSSAGASALRERHPELATKLVLVRCGLDAAWLALAATPVPDMPQLVSVGRLDAQKNPLLLVEAARRLRERRIPFRLMMLGDGDLRPDVERRIRELGLEGCVLAPGWATQERVGLELHAARALVLGSDDEGLPVAIMEAFAVGRPAIATDVGGVRELVEGGVSGWLVPRGDAEALAAAMEQCLTAPVANLQAFADEGRRRVRAFDGRASAQVLAAALARHLPE